MLIQHFLNEIRQMVLYELDSKELINLKPKAKIIPYHRYDLNNEFNVNFYFSTEFFTQNKTFKVNRILDAYGTTEYEVDGKKIVLLNTYGEEDESFDYFLNSKYASVYVICIHYDNIIEIADIVNPKSILPRKRLELKNHMWLELPEPLENAEFCGKRAFYFYRKEAMISLRVNKNIYDTLPFGIKHRAAEEWASGPRVLLHLNPVDRINCDERC